MENFVSFVDEINKIKGSTFFNVLELKESGELDLLVKKYNIYNVIKVNLLDFLKLLLSKDFDNFYYRQKLFLSDHNFSKIFHSYHYFIKFLIDGIEDKNFFIFLNRLVDFFGLSKDFDMNIIYKNVIEKMDLKYTNNPNEVLLDTKLKQWYVNYDDYLSNIIKNGPNFYSTNEFFIWGEHITYSSEYAKVFDFNKNINFPIVSFVSYSYGDGFGYDVLSYDLNLNKEMLIEAKTGFFDNTYITSTEYKVCKKSYLHNADYYVYFYQKKDCNINFIKMKYDYENDWFFDKENNKKYFVCFVPFYEDPEKGLRLSEDSCNFYYKINLINEDDYEKVKKRKLY